MKKCIYCSIKILDKNIIDFCDKCGVGVFGEKMFNAIKRNMEEANEKGDLTYNSPNTFSLNVPTTIAFLLLRNFSL